jgi:nucleoside-diphosphate-sugar epimerase
MNILLTGATGFLGMALAEKFSGQGHKVYGIVREKSSFEKKNLLQKNGVNLLDSELIKKSIVENRIDCVVHAATNYGREEASLSEIFESNLILPLQILKELSKLEKRVTFINTDSFFNKENNIYSPLIDYSLSKKSLLEWLMYFSDLFPVINMRIEHIYGPGDGIAKFIPSITQKLLDPKTTSIDFSPGLQIRDFVYIADVVDSFCVLIKNISGETQNGFVEYQIGTGEGTTIRDMVNHLAILTNSNSRLEFGALPYREREIMSSISNKSFQNEYQWKHQTTLEKGLIEVISKLR